MPNFHVQLHMSNPQTPVELLQIDFRQSSPQPIALSKQVHDCAFWHFSFSSPPH